jgi:uncharacterized protein
MGNLYRSRFNFLYQRSEGFVAYNARTGAIAYVSNEVAALLDSDTDVADIPELGSLVEMGFIHRGDELRKVADVYRHGTFRHGTLNLTIAPTLACNKACAYCYQNEYRTDRVMSTETQDATVRYVRDLVADGCKTVSCTWYGGEPLLAANIVFGLSSRLRAEIYKAGGTLASQRIVTNGVLLDAAAVSGMIDAGIGAVQVSFDALIDTGPTTRGVLDQNGQPSLILRNSQTASKHFALKVRVNVTRSNAGDVEEILSVLKKHGLCENSYLARASDPDGESGCITSKDGHRTRPTASQLPIVRDPGSLSCIEYAKFEQDALTSFSGAFAVFVSRLTPKKQYCSASAGTLHAIDPDGNVSRCWNSMGAASESMGNVRDITSDMAASRIAGMWERHSPFAHASCAKCNVLPLCMGGCPHIRLFMDNKEPACDPIRHQIRFAFESVARVVQLPGIRVAT